MSVTDAQIQVAPDSTGAKVDNSAVTRDDGTVAYRQRVNVSDASDPRLHLSLRGEDGRGAAEVGSRQLLAELQSIHATLRAFMELLVEQLK